MTPRDKVLRFIETLAAAQDLACQYRHWQGGPIRRPMGTKQEDWDKDFEQIKFLLCAAIEDLLRTK